MLTKLHLEAADLLQLITTVFAPTENERWLSILVDMPDARKPDTRLWSERRDIARSWFSMLASSKTPFTSVRFVRYSHVGSNNADLPPTVTVSDSPEDNGADSIIMPLEDVLRNSSVLLALTEFSATAPLKNLAPHFGFRGATLPGFQKEMIPALGLNYDDVNKRVIEFKDRMDSASGARIHFIVDQQVFECYLDLRFRMAHASSGILRTEGEVGNLPSGEAYIVPYEGERSEYPSKSKGILPVQFGDEIVMYEIEGNTAVRVITGGPVSQTEQRRLQLEPAYGNIAELGIGVLGQWGITPVGSILLDEKLGPHIAFGRSEHFGGVTGPDAFRHQENVVHIDRVYTSFTQPRVTVQELRFESGKTHEVVMRNGEFIV